MKLPATSRSILQPFLSAPCEPAGLVCSALALALLMLIVRIAAIW